jgi:hypothetical protein
VAASIYSDLMYCISCQKEGGKSSMIQIYTFDKNAARAIFAFVIKITASKMLFVKQTWNNDANTVKKVK